MTNGICLLLYGKVRDAWLEVHVDVALLGRLGESSAPQSVWNASDLMPEDVNPREPHGWLKKSQGNGREKNF